MPQSLRRVAVSALLLAACSSEKGTTPVPPYEPPTVRPTLPETYRPTGRAAAGESFVHLFDWRWDDVARECEAELGPAGWAAVQVSPPQEHSITPSFDWSERYQPVSYKLDRSRSGTRAEFVDMVGRCRRAGVGIYVDAVINHMTNFPSPGVGSAGTAYTKYGYPGLYDVADFHAPCALTNYQSAANVQDCELFSLPDLRTESPTVRQKIATYLIELGRLGVAGFRVDAAKHIQQGDLDAIMALVNDAAVAEGRERPYWFLEVVGGAGEALSWRDYLGAGYRSGSASDLTEFTFTGVGDKFRGLGGQYLAQLNPEGPPGSRFSPQAWGLMPSDKAVVFLQNHDTQHECGLGYRAGQVFRLATVWMLAQPYGHPSVLSSFAFNCPQGSSMGPPSDAQGWTLPVRCAESLEAAQVGQWVCEHRDPQVRSMVRFRRATAGAEVSDWWDNGRNAIAFSRGDRGFVAINREPTSVAATVQTRLAPGRYCDLLTGGAAGAGCAGTTVTVRDDRTIALTLASNEAVAIDVTTRL